MITVVVRPMLAAEPLSYGVQDGSWIVVARCLDVIDVEIIQPAPGETAEELASSIESGSHVDLVLSKQRVFRRVAAVLAARGVDASAGDHP